MELEQISTLCEAAVAAVADCERHTGTSMAAAISKARLLIFQFATSTHSDSAYLSVENRRAVRDYLRTCTETLKSIVADHRNVHVHVSRLGRIIDRNLVPDISPAAPRDGIFSDSERKPLLDQAILAHLYLNGLEDIAETFIEEAQVQRSESLEKVLEVRKAVDALKRKDPNPALEWLTVNGHISYHSDLFFKLHRLVFRNLMYSHGNVAAVHYAQCHFPQFAEEHKHELQKTMCLLVYESGLLPSSYVSLNDEVLWKNAIESFLEEASIILNSPTDSTLEAVINAGANAIPMLLDMYDKLSETHGSQAWGNWDELPIETEKGFHSVFSCPILRQQTTEDNPPMKLNCGHVISKDALNTLTRNSRLKCPYCPRDQKRSEAKRMHI